MTKAKESKALVKAAPPTRQVVLAPAPDAFLRAMGPPALLPGEDPDIYWAFYDGIRAAIAPTDAIDELYCGEVVAHAWETLRYRRYEGTWLTSMMSSGVRAALSTLLDPAEARRLTKAWTAGQARAMERVHRLLKVSGPPDDVIAAHTLAINIHVVAAINELGMRTAARRDADFREIDRHREAKRRRQLYEDVEEAENEVVSAPKTKEAA